MLCHGNPDSDHCCWIAGTPCPNLLQGQEIADAVQVQVELYNFKGQARNLANRIGDGITFACGVAIKVIAESVDATSQLPDRATFETAWANHSDYQSVADAWETIGKPRSWCPEYGPAEGQCCFAEDATVNEGKAAGIPLEVRGLRNAIGGG